MDSCDLASLDSNGAAASELRKPAERTAFHLCSRACKSSDFSAMTTVQANDTGKYRPIPQDVTHKGLEFA